MRIRVRDLIEELRRFPPDDLVEFEYVRITKQKYDDGCGRQTVRQSLISGAQFDRADETGYVVKIQLAQP